MPRKCCVTNCSSYELENVSLHSFPANVELNSKWKEALINHTDINRLTEYSFVCSEHFALNCFLVTEKQRRLVTGAIPFKIPNENPDCSTNLPSLNYPEESDNSRTSQTLLTAAEIKDLLYTKQSLTQKLKRLEMKYNKLKQEMEVVKKKQNDNFEWKCMEQIQEDANDMVPRAIFILDQIKNYKKKHPRWSEVTIRHCISWRFCSPKGYEFPRNVLFRLPCKTTLLKYFGNRNENLVKDRLLSESGSLTNAEKVCSLVIDDMAVRETVCYSKAEDRIFGLATVPTTHNNIGNKPVVANQLLCFVIYGLSTKYIIPASYYFHRQLYSKNLYNLTLGVLKLLAECGFKVVRIVGDNHKNHVALFKHFGNGRLRNVVPHPYNPGLKLFLSFDYCHALKNARNLFLHHDMASSSGIISASYLKDLFEIQSSFIIKPVRYLTKKHLYPSNSDKMKVNLAVQIFSPSVTASLTYLIHHGGEEFSHFKDAVATREYMEHMYKFFQLHDVSNRTQNIQQNDANTAPYVHISDERLVWLNEVFPQYINDIQSTSSQLQTTGLTKETAEALIFTSRSTYLCIRYLIEDLNFYYVLTRKFSSDAVESLFANVRLRGGSNDLTDCKAAEHAIRQILRTGLITSVNYSNTLNNSETEYISDRTTNQNVYNDCENTDIVITLNDEQIEKLEKLHLVVPDSPCTSSNIEAAATAFLCGYLIMKIEEFVDCQQCLSVLRDNSPVKTNPLLELIYNQDRGKLIYPNEQFVVLIEYVVQLIVEILPALPKENISTILKTIFVGYLQENPMFQCELHGKLVCNIIIGKVLSPILTNYCMSESQKVKQYGNKKRKLLKLS